MTSRQLSLLTESSQNLSRAATSQTEDEFKDAAGEAALYALEAMGLSERALATIGAIITEAKDVDASFDRAVSTGEIVVESTQRKFGDHLGDMR